MRIEKDKASLAYEAATLASERERMFDNMGLHGQVSLLKNIFLKMTVNFTIIAIINYGDL
jgi:hypothetical protein